MIIQSTMVWTEGCFKEKQVEIMDGLVRRLHTYNSKPVDVDYGDQYIMPGFISIHDHGYNGSDANHASTDFIRDWANYLPSEGVTSFYPTTSTMPFEELLNALRHLSSAYSKVTEGAHFLGIHAEGPMFSKEKAFRGSHHVSLISDISIEKFEKMVEASGNHIRLITIAPELEGSEAFIRNCVNENVVVSIGHSGATYEQSKAAIEQGARSFTHTFNGMLGLHHREPGTVGAAMTLKQAYAEIIPDNQHVDFIVAGILGKLKGKSHLITVTDSIFAKEMTQGRYFRPEKNSYIEVHSDGSVRLENGKLAGSVNKMNQLLYNQVFEVGLDIEAAINSVTINPARLMGVDDRKGLIQRDYDADLVISDEYFNIKHAYISGKKHKI